MLSDAAWRESTSAIALAEGGVFHQAVDGFKPRAAQQQMAASVEAVLADGGILVAESGTGTGKTFAYLTPCLLSGKRVIISTGTKHLQEQIFFRDLPRVRKTLTENLSTPPRCALLKGRSNYLCLHRMEQHSAELPWWESDTKEQLGKVVHWSGQTSDGDIAELTDIAADTAIWPMVTSTADNCLGTKCSYFEKCFVNRARRSALAADIVVINHHLFCSDLVLKEDGFGQLLPGHDAVIFDEAHQLPEIASSYLGVSISMRQIRELCADVVAAEQREGSAVKDLLETAKVLDAGADALAHLQKFDTRGTFTDLDNVSGFSEEIALLQNHLFELTNLLEAAAPAGEDLERCWQRAMLASDKVDTLLQPEGDTQVRWFESTPAGLRLHSTPIDLGQSLRPFLQQTDRENGQALVFTSATLAVGEDFSLFCHSLGLQDAQTIRWPSPFDFKNQTLLYLPRGMPEPRSQDFNESVVQAAISVIEITKGRAFLLFTSHRALNYAAERLQGLPNYPVLIQGQAPKSELLDRFRDKGNAVLLGTASFWEGVDVPGEALSCVLIDKLPFASPDEPVLKARLNALEQQGRNPFRDYQLPQAVISLKQGVGRLIRDETDTGLLVICDVRLQSKSYGKSFLNSLPPIPRTDDIEDVRGFFSQ